MEQFVETNGITLSYLDYPPIHTPPDEAETLVLLHGLTANAHWFGGLIKAGLNERLRVISVDLRGRGKSDKPDSSYSVSDHSADVVGFLDALELERVMLGGHSFGGQITIYIGAHYPERVKKMVILDSGVMHPRVRELIRASIERLGKPVASWDVYIEAVKNSPYYHDGFWSDELETFYRADVETLSDGSVISRSKPEAMIESMEGVLAEDWRIHGAKTTQPALLLRAPEGIGPPPTPPIITEEGALQTAGSLPNCEYQQIYGNHVTMMFGDNAKKIVDTVTEFIHRD